MRSGSSFDRGIDLGQRRSIFLLPLINLGQAEMRIHQARIPAQRFAITFLGVAIVLHQPIHIPEFVVVERQVGLDRGILQKFIARLRIILLLQVASIPS